MAVKMLEKDGKEYLIRLGARIKNLRNLKGISQEKFAEKCDFDRTYISLVERGKRNLSIVNLLKIANSLDVKIHDLLSEVK
jgi:transcriptional regulator with XRE-family HTH domain